MSARSESAVAKVAASVGPSGSDISTTIARVLAFPVGIIKYGDRESQTGCSLLVIATEVTNEPRRVGAVGLVTSTTCSVVVDVPVIRTTKRLLGDTAMTPETDVLRAVELTVPLGVSDAGSSVALSRL